MIRFRNQLACTLAALLLSACAGTPVTLGTHISASIPTGNERTISGEACGFQLLLFIPISINDRAKRAYRALELEAEGDFITNIQVQERWIYAFVGTVHCTDLRAKAIRQKSS
jgi:hypothetical protein